MAYRRPGPAGERSREGLASLIIGPPAGGLEAPRGEGQARSAIWSLLWTRPLGQEQSADAAQGVAPEPFDQPPRQSHQPPAARALDALQAASVVLFLVPDAEGGGAALVQLVLQRGQ